MAIPIKGALAADKVLNRLVRNDRNQLQIHYLKETVVKGKFFN
ncbi:hypothetical protein ADIS_4092 [Lunatimonas lonarensis]|uniref:Uncharacterized protein n=1 Tax=Lunatimonas lonarensis TaxID=1232681 RepID=R7ZMS3_9BACT|nr:hypothetical protein ADIS_4092 [Lunatimonas lonarensis]